MASLKLAVVWFVMVWVAADASAQAKKYEALIHKTMPYRLLVPANLDPAGKYPVVLCLHGARARGNDNRGAGSEVGAVLISDESQSKFPCFVLLPQCARGKQWVNVPWRNGSYDSQKISISEELSLALEILETVMKQYPIDSDRVYLAGQSMGGYGAWDALVRRPQLFAAAIINCGGGDPGRADLIAHVPIWNFHGDQDPTVPVQGSRQMVEAIRKAGGTVIQYNELAGAGHYPRIDTTPGLFEWFFAQRRTTAAGQTKAEVHHVVPGK